MLMRPTHHSDHSARSETTESVENRLALEAIGHLAPSAAFGGSIALALAPLQSCRADQARCRSASAEEYGLPRGEAGK